MGVRLAHHLISPNILDIIELSDDYSIVEMKATKKMIGKSLSQPHIRAKYGCNVIAIKGEERMNISPKAEDVIQEENILVIVGDNEHIHISKCRSRSDSNIGQDHDPLCSQPACCGMVPVAAKKRAGSTEPVFD